MNSRIVEFYNGVKPDSEGRMLREIHKWNFEDLEECHDYIQWLFPLNDVSSANYKAPVLTREDIEAFKASKLIQENLIISFELMLSFYGFSVSKNNSEVLISKAESFEVRAKNWLRKYNHNFLRLTRIIKCLKLTGLDNYAQALFNKLQGLYYGEYDNLIGQETYNYWHRAINE